MKSYDVMLCCGAGFSSGFLAQKARKAAKKRKLNLNIEARSESVITEYLDQINILLIGPHYKSAFDHLKTLCEPRGIKVEMIPASTASNIDGEALLDQIVRLTGEEN